MILNVFKNIVKTKTLDSKILFVLLALYSVAFIFINIGYLQTADVFYYPWLYPVFIITLLFYIPLLVIYTLKSEKNQDTREIENIYKIFNRVLGSVVLAVFLLYIWHDIFLDYYRPGETGILMATGYKIKNSFSYLYIASEVGLRYDIEIFFSYSVYLIIAVLFFKTAKNEIRIKN